MYRAWLEGSLMPPIDATLQDVAKYGPAPVLSSMASSRFTPSRQLKLAALSQLYDISSWRAMEILYPQRMLSHNELAIFERQYPQLQPVLLAHCRVLSLLHSTGVDPLLRERMLTECRSLTRCIEHLDKETEEIMSNVTSIVDAVNINCDLLRARLEYLNQLAGTMDSGSVPGLQDIVQSGSRENSPATHKRREPEEIDYASHKKVAYATPTCQPVAHAVKVPINATATSDRAGQKHISSELGRTMATDTRLPVPYQGSTVRQTIKDSPQMTPRKSCGEFDHSVHEAGDSALRNDVAADTNFQLSIHHSHQPAAASGTEATPSCFPPAQEDCPAEQCLNGGEQYAPARQTNQEESASHQGERTWPGDLQHLDVTTEYHDAESTGYQAFSRQLVTADDCQESAITPDGAPDRGALWESNDWDTLEINLPFCWTQSKPQAQLNKQLLPKETSEGEAEREHTRLRIQSGDRQPPDGAPSTEEAAGTKGPLAISSKEAQAALDMPPPPLPPPSYRQRKTSTGGNEGDTASAGALVLFSQHLEGTHAATTHSTSEPARRETETITNKSQPCKDRIAQTSTTREVQRAAAPNHSETSSAPASALASATTSSADKGVPHKSRAMTKPGSALKLSSKPRFKPAEKTAK